MQQLSGQTHRCTSESIIDSLKQMKYTKTYKELKVMNLLSARVGSLKTKSNLNPLINY